MLSPASSPSPGPLTNNQSVPFHQTTWFIVTMFVLVLVAIAAVVVVVFAVRHHRRKQEGSRKYHSEWTTTVCHVSLYDWLVDWLIDWLIDWSINWLVDWLIDWLIDRLIDRPIDWLVDWLIDWLIDWLRRRLYIHLPSPLYLHLSSPPLSCLMHLLHSTTSLRVLWWKGCEQCQFEWRRSDGLREQKQPTSIVSRS